MTFLDLKRYEQWIQDSLDIIKEGCENTTELDSKTKEFKTTLLTRNLSNIESTLMMFLETINYLEEHTEVNIFKEKKNK